MQISHFPNQLSSQNLDALFISDQHNVSYISGFIGLSENEREGFILMTPQNTYLLTFSTYFGLFKKRKDLTPLCISPKVRLSHHINVIAKRENIKRIGFEKKNLTVAELESLQKKVEAEFIPTENIIETKRIIKTYDEIDKIRKAAAITDHAFEFIQTKIKKNVSEKELALELEFFLKKAAGDIAFSPIVAFNEHSAIPHYIPTHDSSLTTHNLILLDFGAKVDGYCADMTRVVFFGKPKNEYVRIYNAVRKTQEAALKSIKPGIKAGIPDQKAKSFIRQQGYPAYLHGLGHGVGLAIHEDPRLKIGNLDKLFPGMVVTVEPGIYIDDTCGVRIEDLVVLNHDGIEILSQSSKELTILS